MEQLSLGAMLEEAQTPGWGKCFATCKNFSNVKEDGSKDYFMDWYRNKPDLTKPRCVVGLRGNNWKSKLINNVWHNYMTCYEPKEEI